MKLIRPRESPDDIETRNNNSSSNDLITILCILDRSRLSKSRRKNDPVVEEDEEDEDDVTPKFKIDGRSASRSEVRDLATRLQIQTDNLCQFLPQGKGLILLPICLTRLTYLVQVTRRRMNLYRHFPTRVRLAVVSGGSTLY